MPHRPRIRHGTPLGGPPLCHSCRYAEIVRGDSESQEIIICRSLSTSGIGATVIPFIVRECTEYHEQSQPTEYEMKEIAWIITGREQNKIGFIRPGEKGHPGKHY